MRGSRVTAARPPAPRPTPPGGEPAGECCDQPITEDEAEERAHGICFKTGPPGRVGVELEWLVRDGRDPALPVDQRTLAAIRADVGAPGALPGGGRLTVEPGGQLELSSAPGTGLADCLASAFLDLAALRQAVARQGLVLAGCALDPCRQPRRVLDEPRYAAMEEFFDRSGPWGRVMMCSTASVQVCLDAGAEGGGAAGYAWRWRLLHEIGPVLVAAFANSPLHQGRATGWKSTRQAIWSRLDPTRTRAPSRAATPGVDPKADWAAYALAANVLCVRRPAPRGWTAPPGLTFRDWLRGAGERPATAADLAYHLSTLFPPVRPRGHLEFRAIDAQNGDGWVVPAAVVAALADDPAASQEAMAAVADLWNAATRDRDPQPIWLRAARSGPADPAIAAASRRCFAAAQAALERGAAPAPVRRAVAGFAERYVERGRCPADDLLDGATPRSLLEDWP